METEVKLRLTDARRGRLLLSRLGFTRVHDRVFESNAVFEHRKLGLRKSGTLVRLRRMGRRALFTVKGPETGGKHKSRPEMEVEVSRAGGFEEMLKYLGFEIVFRYEKYRTEFAEPGKKGIAMLDETPIGVFLELEGTPAWIDRTARRMGFSETDYITASYGALYWAYCREARVVASDMAFIRAGIRRALVPL